MRCLALLAALAACGGSSPPPPAQPANTAPAVSTAPANPEPTDDPPPDDEYGGDPYGGDPYGGSEGSYTPPPHRTDADWKALLAKPIPAQYKQCLAYRDAFVKLSTCDKMPVEAKDSMYQGYEAFLSVFETQNLPPDVVQPLNDACKQGADALAQSMSAMGCAP